MESDIPMSVASQWNLKERSYFYCKVFPEAALKVNLKVANPKEVLIGIANPPLGFPAIFKFILIIFL